MKSMRITALWLVLAIACGTGVVFTAGGCAQKKGDAGLPGETPARFKPVTDGFDFVRREAMIPMRDKYGSEGDYGGQRGDRQKIDRG
jgi:hypothetical protein